jgi:hypothetical protein
LKDLLQLLRYDEATGKFFWISQPGGKPSKDGEAGGIDFSGYRVITYRGKRHKCHRLAWLLKHGDLPRMFNGDRADNRIENLRPSDYVSNGANRREHREGKPLGVTQTRTGGWQAQFWRGGKRVHVGTFKTPEAAHEAYLQRRGEA